MRKTSCIVANQQPSCCKEAKASKRLRDIRLSNSTGHGQRGGLMQECLHDKLLLTFCHSQASLGALDINSFHIPNTHTAGQGSASNLGQGCHETVLSYFQRALEASVTEAILKTVSTDKNHRRLTKVCLVLDLTTDFICCSA